MKELNCSKNKNSYSECAKEPRWSQIWHVETKIKAMSCLLENQDVNGNMPIPEDMQDIYIGLGRILWGLGDELASLRKQIEVEELKNFQKK